MSKKEYYAKAKKLGYRGNLVWTGSTKEQWKGIVNAIELDILHRPNYEDNRAVQPEGLPPMYQEIVNPDKPTFRTVRFPMEDYIGDVILTVDNVDTVKDIAEAVLEEVKTQVDHLEPFYQLKFVMMDGKSFSTHYLRDSERVIAEAYHWLDEFAETYNTGLDEELKIDYIEVDYILQAQGAIQGACKAITDANEKWFMPDSRTRKNCFFISMNVCLKWRSDFTLLTNSAKRIKMGERYKSRLNLPDNLKDGPTYSDFEYLASREMIHLRIYNNLFELIFEYKFGERLVEIRVFDEHAIPMIPRKEILSLNPQFDINYQTQSQRIVPENIVDTRKIYNKKEAAARNAKYVTWDIETYVKIFQTTQKHQRGQDKRLVVYTSGLAFHDDFDPMSRVVCEQFFGHEANLNMFVQYIKDNIEKFSGCTFYAHNGGKFDVILLLRDAILSDSSIEVLGRKLIEMNNSLIGVSIKYRGHIIHFKDSYKMFQAGLSKITKEFKVATPKGHLDHNAINEDTYAGFKDKILEYHRADCVGLLECIDKFSEFAFKTFQINITECFTAASFSKTINKTKYMKTKHGVYRLATSIDKYIRTSYLGGRNECFMLGRIPGSCYYYDFTSLYPFVGTLLLPVGVPSKHDYVGKTIEQALRMNQMGFIRTKVTGTKEMLRFNLPLHGVHKDNRLLFPYIENPIEIVLFTAEIREGLKTGYKYEPIDGYSFERDTVMRNFFRDCSEYKKQARHDGDDAIAAMWKIINNSGYGFWGYNPGNYDTIKLFTKKSHGWIDYLGKNKLKAVNQVHGYTFARVTNDKQPSDTNVAIAAAITSYARIYLHRVILDIQSKGGLVYYCDTDSIISDLKMSDYPDLIKKWRSDKVGEDLGSLKNELGVTKEYEDLPMNELMIAGCKMYSCSGINNKGEFIEFNKLKGYKKEIDGNEKLIHTADKETIRKLIDHEPVEQVQTQLLCNKSDLLRGGNEFQIRITDIKKKFVRLYTKGEVINGTTHSVIFPLTV